MVRNEAGEGRDNITIQLGGKGGLCDLRDFCHVATCAQLSGSVHNQATYVLLTCYK